MVKGALTSANVKGIFQKQELYLNMSKENVSGF